MLNLCTNLDFIRKNSYIILCSEIKQKCLKFPSLKYSYITFSLYNYVVNIFYPRLQTKALIVTYLRYKKSSQPKKQKYMCHVYVLSFHNIPIKQCNNNVILIINTELYK